MSSISSIPPALLALLIAAGVASLVATGITAFRLEPGRNRTAWTLWACASAVFVAGMTFGALARLEGFDHAEGSVNAFLAVYAALAAVGIAARLPPGPSSLAISSSTARRSCSRSWRSPR